MELFYVEIGIDLRKNGVMGWDIIAAPGKESIALWIKKMSERFEYRILPLKEEHIKKALFVLVLDEDGNNTRVLEYEKGYFKNKSLGDAMKEIKKDLTIAP
ncbi:MAG: hypothetical protein Kow0090_09770 [Myxococcota bacterium]